MRVNILSANLTIGALRNKPDRVVTLRELTPVVRHAHAQEAKQRIALVTRRWARDPASWTIVRVTSVVGIAIVIGITLSIVVWIAAVVGGVLLTAAHDLFG